VIPNADGRYLSIGNWRNREWKKATEKTGIDANPYTLRHSFGSMLVKAAEGARTLDLLHGKQTL
jgi:integrase